MVIWALAVAVLVIPCYFGVVQVSELVKAARQVPLQCPLRKRDGLGVSTEN